MATMSTTGKFDDIVKCMIHADDEGEYEEAKQAFPMYDYEK
jgi:hypothetical protein